MKYVVVLAAFAASTLFAADVFAEDVAVKKLTKGGAHDCAKAPVVVVQSKGKQKITLTGACTSVTVGTGANTISAESIGTLDVTGGGNTITVGKLGSASLVGAKNRVTWVQPLDPTKLDVPYTSSGADNVVAKADGRTAPAKVEDKKVQEDVNKAAADASKQLNDLGKQLGIH